VFLINAATFLVSAVLLLRMRVVEPHTHAGAEEPATIGEGVSYILRDRRLTVTLLAKFGLGLMGAHYIILPIFGERVFPLDWGGVDGRRASMLGMSVLMGARGIGALIGPYIGGRWAAGMARRIRSGVIYGYLAAGAGYILLSAAPHPAFAIAAVILAHAGGSIVWVFSTQMLQTLAGDRYRGRVFSADYALLILALSSSSYLGGLAVDHGVAVRTVSLVVGCVVLSPALMWLLYALPLWRDADDA
jgi:MFS family permease